MTDTAVRADEKAAARPAHPLDPATSAEYLAGRDVMAAAGLLANPSGSKVAISPSARSSAAP